MLNVGDGGVSVNTRLAEKSLHLFFVQDVSGRPMVEFRRPVPSHCCWDLPLIVSGRANVHLYEPQIFCVEIVGNPTCFDNRFGLGCSCGRVRFLLENGRSNLSMIRLSGYPYRLPTLINGRQVRPSSVPKD